MILYNWEKIVKRTENKAYRIMAVIDMITNKTIPYNKRDFRYKLYHENFHGTSFLVNPQELLDQTLIYSPVKCSEYVAFASLRSLAHYRLSKEVGLPKDQIPERLLKFIPKNPLMIEDGNFIRFKYEE